jgi:hypothetical protein
MTDPAWGKFITSRPTKKECRLAIHEFNRLLSRLSIPEEIKLGVIFEIHPCYDNTVGRPWYHGIYARIDERATRALQMLPEDDLRHRLSVYTQLRV